MSAAPGLSWFGVFRLGLVQAALGAMVALTTSTLNRVMVVEYALPAMLPAALVGWHYAVQLSRPRWGHGSDAGARRTPWIIGGVGVLALGAMLAVDAAILSASAPVLGTALGVVAFTLIGIGVGAGGTSLLALLAAETAPERRPAAAALAWILMIAGIVVSAASVGALLDPFSAARLTMVAGGVCLVGFLLALVAVSGVERPRAVAAEAPRPRVAFREALQGVWEDRLARRFTVFVFMAMLAYAMQDFILEPFAGLVFDLTPGQSTQLSGLQHGGVLLGMLGVGVLGAVRGGHTGERMRRWTAFGCVASAAALGGLGMAALAPDGWPLGPTVFALGLANGVFAVSAIGAMMSYAGADGGGREGVRMGVWGAAQAAAFGIGGFLGAVGVDVARAALAADGAAFALVFAVEAAVFTLAALVALRLQAAPAPAVPAIPALPAN